MTEPDAIQFFGDKAALFKFTGHEHVVVNSFGDPVIQHPDAASTVVQLCDWVFRRNGQLFACSDVLWSGVVKPLMFHLGEAWLRIEGQERIEERICRHIPEHYEAGYNALEDWANDAAAVVAEAQKWRYAQTITSVDALIAAIDKIYPSEDS